MNTTKNNMMFFHGTSYENYKAIMKDGFADCKPLVWSCADKEVTYLYQLDKLIKAECIEEDDFQSQIFFCLEKADENAQITAAIQNSKVDKTVVFEIEVPENIKEEFMALISPDESCPNMAEAGAVTINSNNLNKYWKEGLIKVTPHFFKYYAKLGLFYIAGLYPNEYLDDVKWDMDDMTREAWKLLHDNGIFIEDLFYFEEVKEDDN